MKMLPEYYERVLEKAKEVEPQKNWGPRKFIKEALSQLEKEWFNKNVFVIEAPTGYGKTSISQAISLYSFEKEMKSIIAFPLRTLLEDQYSKFTKIIPESDIVGKRYMHHMQSLYLIKPITLTTIDTLSLTLFGIPPEDLERFVYYWSGTSSGSLGHYLFSYSSVILSNIVLDEVHLLSDSTKSLNFLFMLMDHAIENGQRIVLMSATLPLSLLEKFEKYKLLFGNISLKDKLEIIRFTDSRFRDDNFINERKNKDYDIVIEGLCGIVKFDKIMGRVKDGRRNGFTKTIVVFNTVEDAIKFYEKLNEEKVIEKEKTLLLHSRFNENDRVNKHKKLEALKDSDSYLIVSTQTIEAGVDVSSNLFITELAPANSLIQRIGRFLRGEKECSGQIYVWYEVDEKGNLKCYENKYKVYDWGLTNRTLEKLKSYSENELIGEPLWFITSAKINFHNPESYQKFLDEIYSTSEFQINENEIKSLLRIFMYLETLSIKSFDKYLDVEGSFVRESMQVPVITIEVTENILRNLSQQSMEEKIKYITNNIIPIPIERIVNLKVEGAIRIERKGEKEASLDLDFPIKENQLKDSKKLIHLIIKEQILALKVEEKYDSEYGLKIIG